MAFVQQIFLPKRQKIANVSLKKKNSRKKIQTNVQKPLMDLSLQWVIPIYRLEEEEWKSTALVVSRGKILFVTHPIPDHSTPDCTME